MVPITRRGAIGDCDMEILTLADLGPQGDVLLGGLRRALGGSHFC